MRKICAFVFAAAFVLALALPAQAQQAPSVGKYLGAADFGFRGWFMHNGGTTDNQFDFDDDQHDATRIVFQRYRWWFDASFEGKYGGTIGMEWNWIWGQDNASTARSFPNLQSGAAANLNFAAGPRGDDITDITRMKNAYVWFFVPGTPVKLTAGLQTNIIDPDALMFGFNADWFGIRMDVPLIKNVLNLSAAWLKQDEGMGPNGIVVQNGIPQVLGIARDMDSQDADIYYANLTGALAKWFTFGTYHVYERVADNGFAPSDTWAGLLNNAASGQFFGRTQLALLEGDYFWHGLHVALNPGIFYFRGHANYFHGHMSKTEFPRRFLPNQGVLLGNRQQDEESNPYGWAFHARGGVRLGPASVGVRGWYFTGNKEDPLLNGGNDVSWRRWVSPDGYFAPFEIFYGGARNWGVGLNGNFSTNPGGSAAVALEADYRVTKDLLLDLIAGPIWATRASDKPIRMFTNRVFTATPGLIPGAFKNNDLLLGYEVDLRATYRIYQNLSLDLIGAYFIAEDGLDHVQTSNNLGLTNPNQRKGADDAYELSWRLVFEF